MLEASFQCQGLARWCRLLCSLFSVDLLLSESPWETPLLLCPASPAQVECGLLRSVSSVGRQPGGAQLVPESGLISSSRQTSLHLDPVAIWDVGLASVPGLEFAHERGDLLLEALSSSWTFPGRPGHVWFSMLVLGCAFEAVAPSHLLWELCVSQPHLCHLPVSPCPHLPRGSGCILSHPQTPSQTSAPPHPRAAVLGPEAQGRAGLRKASRASFPAQLRTLVSSLASASCPTHPRECVSPGEVGLGARVVMSRENVTPSCLVVSVVRTVPL